MLLTHKPGAIDTRVFLNFKRLRIIMNKISISLAAIIVLMSGCSEKPEESKSAEQTVKEQPASAAESKSEVQNLYGTSAQPHQQTTAPEGADVQTNSLHVAKVVETMDAAGYTYAKVDEEGNVYWIAGPQSSVQVGSSISYIEQMVMTDFTSKSLNRKFDYLMFASTIIPAGKSAGNSMPAAVKTESHAAPSPADNSVQAEVIKVAKADGGYSVEELYAKKDELQGKAVTLQAKVVKVSKNIMGKDWIHLQDGSGVVGSTNDLTVTGLNTTVAVGDIVTAKGTLNTDVDLGYGYFFPVIMQESTFSK